MLALKISRNLSAQTKTPRFNLIVMHLSTIIKAFSYAIQENQHASRIHGIEMQCLLIKSEKTVIRTFLSCQMYNPTYLPEESLLHPSKYLHLVVANLSMALMKIKNPSALGSKYSL